MIPAKIAPHDQWLEARRALLELEKAHTRQKDEITRARQALPWVRLQQEYLFETDEGEASLTSLFKDHNQLVVYHFMFGPEWKAGCVSCSFWADSFDGISAHLAARDIAFVAVSSAPMSMIAPFKQRMGWGFDWVSSSPGSFNEDFDVGFGPKRTPDRPLMYNFTKIDNAPMDEMHGTSVFAKDDDGTVYHTYSTYGRGLDATNAAYAYIDLTPAGRNEPATGNPMAWVRHHDVY